MAALEQAQIEALKAKHGELTELKAASGDTVVVCAPNRPTWKRFQSQILDDKQRSNAIEALLRTCIVYPSSEDVELMLNRRPGLIETFGKEVVELGGAGQEVQKKAL